MIRCDLCGLEAREAEDDWFVRFDPLSGRTDCFCPACVERRRRAAEEAEPLTPAEAERAYNEAEAAPLSEGQIDRMMDAVKRMITVSERRN